MPISNDFITRLEENARNQNRVVVPNITQDDLLLRERLSKVSEYEAEKVRKSQPSYASARKLFNKETTQDIIFDVREKNALTLQQAARKADPVKLKEDLDGVFGGKNPLTKFLLGSGIRDEDLGKEKGIFESIGSRGLLGFFTGELLRSTPESEANVYEVLLDTGLSPEEAFKKARARVAGDNQVLTSEEVSALQTYEKWDTAFKMLDAGFLTLDVATLGTAGVVRPMVKSSARKVVAPFIKEAQTMTKRSDLRNLVVKTYPELKGSEELEKMLDIVEEYPADFSLFKARQDFQRTETFNELAKTVSPTPVKTATEMQRVVYENGIPVLRKTTPDTLVARRTATLDALKGKSESLRLSNADILQQEIRAGALPINTTADTIIPVWRVSPRGRRIKAGEEVSITEDFAKSLSEGAKISKIDVPVADIVRLPDGTYTFAPERLIKESPILKFPKNISKEVIDETMKKEAKVIADKLAKDALEKAAKREAALKAERELRRPVEEAKAKIKKIEEKPTQIRIQTQAKIIKETQLRAKEVGLVVKDSTKKISDIDNKFTKDKQAASIDHIKRMKLAKTKLQKQREKIRYQNKISKLKKKANLDKLKIRSEQKSRIAVIKTQSRLRSIEIRKDGSRNLKEAQKAVAGARSEVRAIIKKADIRTPKDANVEDSKLQKNITSKKSSKESLKPVGEGAVQESRLYESVQSRVREVQKEIGQNINSKDYEFYRQASNKAQIQKATTYIVKNGVEKTIKELEIAFRTGGDAVPGVLNNAMLLALEPELLKSGMSKYADKLLRLSSSVSTRFGQEIQILSVLDRNNPLYVLKRLQDSLDELVGNTDVAGITINKGSKDKARTTIEEMIAKIDIKSAAKESLDDIICKV